LGKAYNEVKKAYDIAYRSKTGGPVLQDAQVGRKFLLGSQTTTLIIPQVTS
jgi:hypothetical protein